MRNSHITGVQKPYEELIESRIESPAKYSDYPFVYLRIYDATYGNMRLNYKVKHSLVFRYPKEIGRALWRNDVCLLQHPTDQYAYAQVLPNGDIIRYSNGYDVFRKLNYRGEYVTLQRSFHTVTHPGGIIERM